MKRLGMTWAQLASAAGVAENTALRAAGSKRSSSRSDVLAALDRLEAQAGIASQASVEVEVLRVVDDTVTVRVSAAGRPTTLILHGLTQSEAVEAAARYVRSIESQ